MENQVIDKYEIISKVGEGAFGVVYKARNLLRDKVVALKIIKGAPESQLNSYLREIRKMDKLRPPHPNVVEFYTADIKDGCLLIEMEYFEGETLRQTLEEGLNLTDDTIVDFLIQILDGLSYIHSKMLVHRDIKPDNILVNTEYTRLKIADFGISKDLEGSESYGPAGTMHYMSPENVNGEKIDHRSDIYSLGIVLYELKTGLVPHKGAIGTIMDGHRYKTIPKIKSFLDPVIQKATKKNPKDRYQSAEEFKLNLIRSYKKSKKKIPTIKIFYFALSVVILYYSYKGMTHTSNNAPSQIVKESSTVKKSNITSIKTVTLGEQIWMTENLNANVFRNGDSISEAKTKEEWDQLCKEKKPAYCHWVNDASNDNSHGILYNWYVVNDDRNICPVGFRLPKKKDIEYLKNNYIYNRLVEKMKLRLSGWRSGDDGKFYDFGSTEVFWCEEPKYITDKQAAIYTLKIFNSDGEGNIKIGEQKPNDGYSIRCLKE